MSETVADSPPASDRDRRSGRLGREFRLYGRYLFVGCCSAVADLGTYALLTRVLKWAAELANVVSRPVGGMIGFVLHKFFTFGNRGRASTPVQLGRFWTIWILAYLSSTALVSFYTRLFDLEPMVGKLAAETTIGVASFLLQRFWTFR